MLDIILVCCVYRQYFPIGFESHLTLTQLDLPFKNGFLVPVGLAQFA